MSVTSVPQVIAGPSDPGSTAPTISGGYDGGLGGSSNTNLFVGPNGILVPGDSVTIEFSVEVDPDANGAATSLDNTAEVAAVDPSGTPVTDDSDSGTDPNGTNPGEPGDTGTEDDPTPLSIPDIRTTKALSADPIDNGDGTWTLPFELNLENTGTVDLVGPRIIDNLRNELGAAVFQSVNSITLDTTGAVSYTHLTLPTICSV